MAFGPGQPHFIVRPGPKAPSKEGHPAHPGTGPAPSARPLTDQQYLDGRDPSLLLLVSMPVFILITLTAAAATTPPVGSVTFPTIDPEVVCAMAGTHIISNTNSFRID